MTDAPDNSASHFIELDPPDPAALAQEWNFNDRAQRLYETGHRLLARGFFREAADLFERATRWDRTHYYAYVGQSEALVLLARTEEAVEIVDAALERYGRSCELGAARAHLFLHQNRFDEALEFSDIAMHNAPESAYAWLIGGEVRLALNVRERYAGECFQRARHAADDWPHMAVRIALAHLEWDHVAAATRRLERAVRQDPGLPLPWILLGDAHRLQGNSRLARECYRRAAVLAPQLDSLRLALGWRTRAAEVWQELRLGVRRFLRKAKD